jgi:hypothetical protein
MARIVMIKEELDMAHGYLGDGFGTHGEIDPDREDRDREHGWRERSERWRDRDRAAMFGDRNGGWDRGEGSYGGYPEGRRGFSANPDEHYLSWRDRHMSELDREYQEYCIEREEQFQRDFDAWRQQRHGNPQPLRTGMAQTGLSADPTGMTEAASEMAPSEPPESDPMATATLGSQSGGRGKRR